MAKKVDSAVLARMVELRDKHRLTKAVIAIRLGLSLRTVNYYLNPIPCTILPSPLSV